jgi:hypothetical protein
MNPDGYGKDVFPNGLRLITVEMPHLHSVEMACYLRVGGRDEGAEAAGISHFLEHMLFRGTTRVTVAKGSGLFCSADTTVPVTCRSCAATGPAPASRPINTRPNRLFIVCLRRSSAATTRCSVRTNRENAGRAVGAGPRKTTRLTRRSRHGRQLHPSADPAGIPSFLVRYTTRAGVRT